MSEEELEGEDPAVVRARKLRGFKIEYCFDISQTEGERCKTGGHKPSSGSAMRTRIVTCYGRSCSDHGAGAQPTGQQLGSGSLFW